MHYLINIIIQKGKSLIIPLKRLTKRIRNDRKNINSKILLPENFFALNIECGDKIYSSTIYEKYLKENVLKINDKLLPNLKYTILDDNEKKNSKEIINKSLYKLGSVIYHFNNFRQLYVEINEIANNSKKSMGNFDRVIFDVPRLGYEVEALFLQIKSTLDILINILKPVFKINTDNKTFGNKGEKIINALKNNLSDKHSNRIKLGAENLINLIKQAQTTGFVPSNNYGWLNLMIDARDKLAHFNRSKLVFYLEKEKSSNLEIRVPRIVPEQSYWEGLEVIVYNFVMFVEEFLLHAVGCSLDKRYKFCIVEQRKFEKDFIWCNSFDWILSTTLNQGSTDSDENYILGIIRKNK